MEQATTDELVLQTDEELEQFFADLTGKVHFLIFRDVELETFRTVTSETARSLISMLLTSLSGRHRGIHVRLWLPKRIDADLLLETRPGKHSDGGEDTLDALFQWSATRDDRVRRYLQGPLLQALAQIAEEHHVRINDGFIQFGPIHGSPAETARLVSALVDALPRPEAQEGAAPEHGALGTEDGDSIVVQTVVDRVQADLMRTLLEASNIPCHLRGYEHSPPWGAATPPMPIELMVPRHHEARAREILERAREETEGQQEAFCFHCGEPLPDQTEICPQCGMGQDSDAPDPTE